MNHRVVRSLKPSFAPPLPEELTNNLSCDEMAVLKVQSESINF
ncbi:hypothetical protein QUA47_25800 [Microcoleus sp. MON2_D5]